jgi:hypothetical protein
VTKIVTTEAEAPAVAAPITARHRASASAQGFSIDATIAALRQSLAEAHHALGAIVTSAPDKDSNLTALQSLHRQVLHCIGSVDLLAPEPARTHTLFDGRR